MKAILIVLLVGTLCLLQASAATDKVVCYFGSWATYRRGNGQFSVENIDTDKCTHVIYSFVGINNDGTIRILDSWNEIDLGALKRFNALKNKNKNLKTLIAIGGWNEGSLGFSTVSASSTKRTQLAKSAVQFMEEWGFDGFDLDWEYPAQRGGGAADKANFVKLMKELREKFDAGSKKYLLTAAVAATATATDISYDVPALSQYLDFINVMAYDFHGSYDHVTGQNAPLYASSIDTATYAKERNVDASIKAWLKRGAAPEKIVLGLGVYGRTYTLSNSKNNGLGAATSNAGNQGPYTEEAGMLGYNEICEMQKAGGWTEVWDNEQKVPYIYKGNQWVGFDNARSIKLKVEYAKSLKLGGLMIWSIETDDFRGICGSKYPILSAIVEAIGSSTPSTSPTPAPTTTTTKQATVSTNTPTTTTKATTTTTTTTSKPTESGGNIGTTCTKEGFMRDSNDCKVFYQCTRKLTGGFTQTKFTCSGDLVFDTTLNVCNYAHSVTC